MNTILGIDTSGTDLGIGIYQDAVPVAAYSRFIGNSHAEHITPVIKALLDANAIDPSSIHHIAVAAGPGSFTGLRIGIAFVKGFAAGTGARIHPVSSLYILAHLALPLQGTIVAAIDARNNDVYHATFQSGTNGIRRITEDTLIPYEAFLSTLTSETILVTDTLGNLKSTAFVAVPQVLYHLSTSASLFCRGLVCAKAGSDVIANSTDWKPAHDVQPAYLRKSTPELKNPDCVAP